MVETRTTAIEVPIFPLPSSILFPGVYVPFHIFEDRYKAMLKSIETINSELAVSYAPEMQPGKYFPSMVCGVGTVRVIKRYQSGESDILVFGTKRVKFSSYAQEVPFLIGKGEVLLLDKEMPKSTEDQLVADIRDMLINWIFNNFDDASRPIQFFKMVNDLEALTNFVGYYFADSIEEKQKILEENSLEAKAQMIWKILKNIENGATGPALNNQIIFPGNKKRDEN